MSEIHSENPFAAPKTLTAPVDVSPEWRQVRTGFRLLLVAMCVQLVAGVAMQFLFWQSSPTPSSVGSKLLEIASFITVGTRLIEITAAAFLLRVPASTGARALAKIVLALSILTLLVNWLAPRFISQISSDWRGVSIVITVVSIAYGIAVLIFMSRIARYHQQRKIEILARIGILLKSLLTAISLALVITMDEIPQTFSSGTLLIGLFGLGVVSIEITVAYQLLRIIGCGTNDQSLETNAQMAEAES